MPALVITLVIAAHLLLVSGRPSGDGVPTARRRVPGDRGQATTEYALILLAAALVALLVVAWATAGGGAARVGQLFDRVLDGVIDRV